MRITDGHLAEFKDAVAEAVAFVEEHGPQLAVQVFVDDDAMLAHSFQLYPDSAAIARHRALSDPSIQAVMAHGTIERLTMYGEPDEAVLGDAFRPTGTEGIPRAVIPRHIGFLRGPSA